MKSSTRVNGFLVDRDLANRIIIAVARHDPGQRPRGLMPWTRR
jgi:hypothetical protein